MIRITQRLREKGTKLTLKLQYYLPERAYSVGSSLAFITLNDNMWIQGIGVHNYHQNKGIGSKMLTLLIEYARQTGCKYVSLKVFSDNARAIRLYERFGFRIFHADVETKIATMFKEL